MPATTTPEAEAIITQALKLSVAERDAISRRLRDSIELPPNTFESPEALREELNRRIDDVESGRVKALTPEEVHAHIRKALEEQRS